jgi:hypothetical protein
MRPVFLNFVIYLLSTFLCLSQDTITIIATGKKLNVNGHNSVPEGLFGVHAGNFSFNNTTVDDWGIVSARYIQQNAESPVLPGSGAPSHLQFAVTCWFDRFKPALQLTNSSWNSSLANSATNFANSSNPGGYSRHLEFWNEPYLNWAYKPGLNTDPYYYESSGISKGDPVYVKGESQPEPYLVWDSAQWYDSPYWAADRLRIYNAISHAWNSKIWGGGNCPYPCLDALKTGEIYNEGTNKEFTVIETLRPVDTSQHYYYSARQQEVFYSEMYEVVGSTVESIDNTINMVAGWGFEVHKDNWYPWYTLFKPMIDKHIDIIDGIHEHHYGMDTRIIAADYETMASYVKAKYGKELKFYNTETGGFLDPQRPDTIEGGAGNASPGQKALNAFSYNIRDIIYMTDKCPDKAFSRAVHEPQNTNDGVEMAFKMGKTLRGDLYYAETSDKNVYSVSSLDGNTYTILCFNNNESYREIKLDIVAPDGTTISSADVISIDTTGAGQAELNTFVYSSINNPFWQLRTGIKAFQAIAVECTLNGTVSPTVDSVTFSQYTADTILVDIPSGQNRSFSISIPHIDIDNAVSARLKYVLMNYTANGSININGSPYSIKNYCGGNPTRNLGGITYQPINLSDVQSINNITVNAGDDDAQVWMMSIELINDNLYDSISVYYNAISETDKLVVYPNPAKNILYIDGLSHQLDKCHIKIYSMDGRLLKKEKNTGSINISELNQGIYIVHVAGKTVKVIVTNPD